MRSAKHRFRSVGPRGGEIARCTVRQASSDRRFILDRRIRADEAPRLLLATHPLCPRSGPPFSTVGIVEAAANVPQPLSEQAKELMISEQDKRRNNKSGHKRRRVDTAETNLIALNSGTATQTTTSAHCRQDVENIGFAKTKRMWCELCRSYFTDYSTHVV